MKKQQFSGTLKKYNYLESAINEQYHVLAASFGLSDSAFNILYALYEEGDGCQQSTLYKAFGMSRKTVGSSLQKLQENGILTIRREETGRGNRVYLTPEGEKLMDRAISPVVEAENKAFADWAPEEKETFLSLSNRFLNQITEEFKAVRELG